VGIPEQMEQVERPVPQDIPDIPEPTELQEPVVFLVIREFLALMA
jgi:hypothetical protein